MEQSVNTWRSLSKYLPVSGSQYSLLYRQQARPLTGSHSPSNKNISKPSPLTALVVVGGGEGLDSLCKFHPTELARHSFYVNYT